MNKPFKFALPSPNFNKNFKDDCKSKPHYLTPSGMSLLPREKQPPPMYGKHGTTLPARYLNHHAVQSQQEMSTTTDAEKHYCEPCETEFNSLDDLKRHRAQHEKCPVANCLYKGHPSIMDKHVNSLHASGLYDKFKKLNTPEELAAWREERRKRYPTLANVLLKQKAKEQRQKRGERLEEGKSRFGSANNKKRARNNVREGPLDDKKSREDNKKNSKINKKRKNKPKRVEIKPKAQLSEKRQNEVVKDDTGLNCDGIAMFRGTSQLKDYKHFNENKLVATNALFGLVGMYGSDDDESIENDSCNENEENIETLHVVKNGDSQSNNLLVTCNPNQDREVQENQTSYFNNDLSKGRVVTENHETDKDCFQSFNDISQKGKKASTLSSHLTEESSKTIDNEPYNKKDKSSDDEPPEEAPIQRKITALALETEQQPMPTSLNESKSKSIDSRTQKMVISRQKLIKKFGLNYRKARLRKQNTLLEKLLEFDIRHERNVLLQCVRFVCENKFFNQGEKKNEKNTDKL